MMAAKVVEAQRRLHYLAAGGSECISRIDKKTAAAGKTSSAAAAAAAESAGVAAVAATSEVEPVKMKKG